MRQIVLDTETTGLNVAEGHRVIEIGGVELINRRLTERRFHVYLNPERAVDPGALEVHGLTDEFLQDKPKFVEVHEELMDFLSGSELLIHNAAFDVGFLNAELSRLRSPAETIENVCSVTDTLAMAREKHPNQRNSLDALCKRYGVNNQHRNQHGALLDAELLAHVYLAMTTGQSSLLQELEAVAPTPAFQSADRTQTLGGLETSPYKDIRVIRASTDELKAHSNMLALINSKSKQHHWITDG